MNRRDVFASLAFGLLAAGPLFFGACGSSSNQGTEGDAGGGIDGGLADSAFDAFIPFEYDAPPISTTQCRLPPELTDPVGFCTQKAAILAIHAAMTDAGVPSDWSVDTLAPATDGGVVAHDVREDVAYGAALSAYAASAAAYTDTQINALVTSDLTAMAHRVETELATLPADYDGALYLRLRRFASGLRAAGISDADAIDQLAVSYATAIYTTYFHPIATTSSTPLDDGGSDASDDAATDGSASDAGLDAGAPTDGILGTPSGSGFAYRPDLAASGAWALFDMAVRATNGNVLSVDAGVDATALANPTEALAWSQAANLVVTHLRTRARDTSGLYFTQLQTSGDPLHDTVTDDASFATETEGAVALSYAHIGSLLTGTTLSGLPPKPFVDQALALLNVLQTSPLLWDEDSTRATLTACNASVAPLTTCGSGYFAGIDSTKTVFDTRKSTLANARLFAALHRSGLLGTLAESNDLIPMFALFDEQGADAGTGYLNTNFFSQLPGQSACVHYVTQNFSMEELADGGVVDGGQADPLARYYSAEATLEALESLNEQWVGMASAPSFFQ